MGVENESIHMGEGGCVSKTWREDGNSFSPPKQLSPVFFLNLEVKIEQPLTRENKVTLDLL